MTKQDKELLLKDLSARLPYGVWVQYSQKTFTPQREITVDVKIEVDDMLQHRLKLLDFKPYLRPMSSMTEEEIKEYTSLIQNVHWTRVGLEERGILSVDLAECKADNEGSIENVYNVISLSPIDYLNAHHLDYRGLISKGLALPAPDGMYNF